MRRLPLALLLCVALLGPASAAQQGWMLLSAGALSLAAPPGSTLRTVAPGTWELHNRDLTLGIAVGPKVVDADDAEPRRCIDMTIVPFDRGTAVLRTTRPAARADCPEGYASLYRPPAEAGQPAMFLWAWDETSDGYAALEAIVKSIHLSSGPEP